MSESGGRQMQLADSNHSLYVYVSSIAGFDPVRTVYLCAPGWAAADAASAEAFAAASGWTQLCEAAGAVLVMPIVSEGWTNQDPTLIQRIYRESANSFKTRSGRAIWGRQGRLWCWETLLYLVGYEDGAAFAGRVLIRCPNVFAGAALINGVADDFSDGDRISDHWFVKTVSGGYQRINREVPICLWLFGRRTEAVDRALRYFSFGLDSEEIEVEIRGVRGIKRASSNNPAWQVRFFEGDFVAAPMLAALIYQECFECVIRWKNGPDGMLTLADRRDDFYQNPRFLKRAIEMNSFRYDYFVHLPSGLRPEDVRGLPLVFTIHGRGEPAWLFTAKNGWDTLADETREFVLVSPDSPGNIWFLERDGEALCRIAEATIEEFGLDPERIFLTGFSNGGMIAREVGIRYPELFAGISPWNAPKPDSIAMSREDRPIDSEGFSDAFQDILTEFLAKSVRLPAYYIFGDQDPAASPAQDLTLASLLRANRCRLRSDPATPTGYRPDSIDAGEVAYPGSDGYREGERMTTYCYCGEDGETQVCVSLIRDLPHGAIHDESRAAWNFLKRFRRIRTGEMEA